MPPDLYKLYRIIAVLLDVSFSLSFFLRFINTCNHYIKYGFAIIYVLHISKLLTHLKLFRHILYAL